MDINNPKILKNIEKSLNKNIEKKSQKIVKLMQTKYKTDIFGFGNKLYKQSPKKWKKINTSWDDKYFPKLNIKIKANIKITKTGSLNKSVQEGHYE